MVEIMPFGRMKDKSVEQILLEDYKYFTYIKEEIKIKKPSLKRRFEFVDFVANNFISAINCRQCNEKPAEYISIYNGYGGVRTSSGGFIYCSNDCYSTDPSVTTENKSTLYPLAFKTTLSATKGDTNHLAGVIAECMGLKAERRTKDYLYDFFNNCRTKTTFNGILTF